MFSILRKRTSGDKLQPRKSRRGEYALFALILGALCGWLLIAIFASPHKNRLDIFGTASMVAAASILAGAFLGFLFGIPRTLQKADDVDDEPNKAGAAKKSSYRPNTNLEQISDWLTKILVGAGLTQIGTIRHWVDEIGTNLAPGFGDSVAAKSFAVVTILAYLLNGFLVGYLWTRLYLAGALQDADVQALAREIQDIRLQSDVDAKALALAIRQLNPSGDVAPPTQQELDVAIKDASPSTKAQIFYQAAAIRQENWSEPARKAKMERTIPLFRALVACDKDDEFHRNHGQLGFALKDQRSPEWLLAEQSLTKAIQIRGLRPSGPGFNWLFYEFNRALCRINLDEDFKKSKKSSPEITSTIMEDLDRAKSDPSIANIIGTDRTIQDWLSLNEK
jgi:hypothetical protein